MKNIMKEKLTNDVITGLLVAATFAIVSPCDAFSALTDVAGNTGSQVLTPIVKILSYISYGLGTVFTVKGISDVKKHTENPTQGNLGKGLGALGAGGAFLVAPAAVQMLQSTGAATLGSGSSSVGVIPGS